MDYKTLKTICEYFVIKPEYLKPKKSTTMKKPVIELHIHIGSLIGNYNVNKENSNLPVRPVPEEFLESIVRTHQVRKRKQDILSDEFEKCLREISDALKERNNPSSENGPTASFPAGLS